MLCQLFDTVNAGKYQKSKEIATDSNLIWDVMAFLTLLYFPLETTCSCKQDTKERYLGQQFWWSGKAHFGSTDRNDQTCHCRPPSKLVPNSLNIPVGPNRNGPFHLVNQPKFPEFWVGVWKSGNPESGIGTGTGTGTGIGTGMGRETYIKAGTTFTLI